jgi:NAD(P)-dependent dehydrogenase (short-subunit alcohol dehydrogenase family)
LTDISQKNIEILVNAAGVSQMAILSRISEESIHDIINTNLITTMALCKRFIQMNMRRSVKIYAAKDEFLERVDDTEATNRSAEDDSDDAKSTEKNPKNPSKPLASDAPLPSIINISSVLAQHGGYGSTIYAASKAGVLGFTRALVAESATTNPDMRINCIVPGYIDTPMTQGE